MKTVGKLKTPRKQLNIYIEQDCSINLFHCFLFVGKVQASSHDKPSSENWFFIIDSHVVSCLPRGLASGTWT